MIRLIVVDDSAVFRRCLRSLLVTHSDMSVVAEAENGLTAIDAVGEHRPDIVLMDISMPVMNGIDATRAITSKHPAIRVIILSMHSDNGMRVAAREAGAARFLMKDCQSKGLIEVIRSTHASVNYSA
jgi:DNA-binding NarL/FixJ family response regulator